MPFAMSAPRACRLTAAFGSTTALRAALPRVQGRRARLVTRMGVCSLVLSSEGRFWLFWPGSDLHGY